MACVFGEGWDRRRFLFMAQVGMTGRNAENLVRTIMLETSSPRASNLPEGYAYSNFSSRVLKFVFSTCTLSRRWKGLV